MIIGESQLGLSGTFQRIEAEEGGPFTSRLAFLFGQGLEIDCAGQREAGGQNESRLLFLLPDPDVRFFTLFDLPPNWERSGILALAEIAEFRVDRGRLGDSKA